MKKLTALLLSVISAALLLSVTASAVTPPDEFTEYIREQIGSFTETVNISSYAKSYGWTREDAKKMLEAVFYKSPMMYYLNNNSITIYRDSITNMPVQFEFSYTFTRSEKEKADKKIEQAAQKLLDGITDDMNDVDKALYVHDYLILNCSYDYINKNRNVYGCLVNKTTMCQGYALTYEYILNDLLGIECTTVISDSQNHMWNYVKIGNKWYHVDLTADDPLFYYKNTGYDRFGFAKHENFLMSDARCKESDGLHRDWHVIGDEPAASDKSYDNAFWRGIDSKIIFVDGVYYYVRNGGESNDKLIAKICRYDPETKKGKALVKLKSVWYATRDSSGSSIEYGKIYYSSVYSSLEYLNGKLYFNSNKNVYSYNLSTNKYKKIYTLNKGKEQQIYGMVMVDGKLRTAYKKDYTYDAKYLKLVLK